MKRLRLLLAALLLATGAGLRPAPVRAATPAAAACAVCGHECCCPETCAKILANRRAAAPGCAARDTTCRLDPRPSAALSSRDADVGAPAVTVVARALLPADSLSSRAVDPRLSPHRSDRDVPVPPPRDAA